MGRGEGLDKIGSIVKCSKCNNKYIKKVAWQKCCSKKCTIALKRESGISRYSYTCQGCGKIYHPKQKDRKTFCSRKCAYKNIHLWASFRKKDGTIRSEEERKESRLFKKASSDPCNKAYACWQTRIIQYNKKIIKTITCKWCGVTFKNKYGIKRRKFCCPECLKKYNDTLRRNKERAKEWGIEWESINPFDIYFRDGWICQICKGHINKKAKHPHPMSASLDHIVPLSKGGTHTDRNVQCAHLICNISKGAKIDKENIQYRLC